MKSHLLFAIAAAAVLSMGAQTPATRAVSATNGTARQLNSQPHRLALKPAAPLRELAAAPENTVEVPFTHDLGKAGTEVVNYTAINVNDDNRKWQYHSVNGYAACMAPNSDGIDANDDWLITVPVHMPAGNYVVSFEVGMLGSSAVEFDCWLFTEPTLEGKLAEIAPTTRHTSKDFTKYEFNCAIPEEGYYYVGVHCTTKKADGGTMKLANLGVRAGSVTPPVVVDPPAAGTLTYTLAPKGALQATLTYVAPTKTVGGAELETISKVELTSRWTVDKFYFEDVQPGQTIVQEVPMYAGYNNRFTATAYIDETAGETVEIKNIFCGPDTPLPPTDVTLKVNDDYMSATLSWTAPGEVGENGGYVDTDNLTYYIFDAFGSYYDPALFETDRTSVTISYEGLEGQDFFAYQVTAGVGDYYSLDNSSKIVVAGQPGAMPFGESFAGGLYDGYWAISEATTSSSTHNYGTVTDDYFASLFDPEDPEAPEPLKSHDGDEGFYYWLPFDASAVFGLTSVRTDISAATNPVLEFWYQGQGSKIEAFVAGGTDEPALAHAIDLQTNPTTGWTLARIPLDQYKAQGAVMFELRLSAVHNDDDHIWSVPLDNIRIRDLVPADLHIVTSSISPKVSPSASLECKAHIENRGTEHASTATATLTINGKAVEVKELEPIAPDAFADVAFAYQVPLNAPAALETAVVFDTDGEASPADNHCSATVEVVRPAYATVTDLTATVDGRQVQLSWSAPVNDVSVPVVVSEDFESADYTPMTIGGVGEWTVYDGDGVKTYNVFRELYNPYQTQPMAFQLFNRDVAQVPDSYYEDAQAHSGDNFMLAPSAQSAINDNWLISPALSGNAQAVTFWARSYMSAWPESFDVYYSTGDNSRESFVNSVEVKGEYIYGIYVPEVWTLYTVELPAGATYFAINHNSDDTLALFVDDVTYEGRPAIPDDLVVEGYHLFRNGEQVSDELITGTTYTDSPLADDATDGVHAFEYTVVPVYNYGPVAESAPARVSIEYSGVETIAIDSLGADTVVYDLQGRRVQPEHHAAGIYIVNGRKIYLK